MVEEKRERLLLWATTVAYTLIALEVPFMITPFALYFYGVYGPILAWLSASYLTAWTTEFFLPHMVFVEDPFLNGISYLQGLFVVGLVLFLLVSVYPRPQERLQELYRAAVSAPPVRDYLTDNPIQMVYVVPGDFFLTGLVLQEGPRFSEEMLSRYPHLRESRANRHSGGLVKFFRLGYKFFRTIGTTRRAYDYERLVFVDVQTVAGQPATGDAALQIGVKRLPALVVDIDAETDEILSVSEVSGNNAWGRLPMPNI